MRQCKGCGCDIVNQTWVAQSQCDECYDQMLSECSEEDRPIQDNRDDEDTPFWIAARVGKLKEYYEEMMQNAVEWPGEAKAVK